MKVLLVTPYSAEKVIMSGDNLFLHEPLALEYVGAGIRGSHDVKLLDMRIDKDLEGTLDGFRPDVVGTTAYTVHVNVCRNILKRVKDHDPRILTVIGGHHATISPESFNESCIDVIVTGEGVFAFREMVGKFERGEDLKGIPGVVIRETGILVVPPPRPYSDLDEIPFPDRSLTAGDRGKYFTSGMRPVASIRTSVGCAFRCNFCALWKITGSRYLTRDPRRIVEELSTIREPCVLFTDDETFLNVERMKALADYIEAAGIRKKYQASIRSDTVVRNPDLIEKWGEIGLSRVRIGFESYLDEELDSFNKKTTVSMNERALEFLERKGIEVVAQFIVRQDYDGKKFRELARYVKRKRIKYISYSVLTPLPGTMFYEEVKDRMISGEYDLFDFKHTLLPTTLPLERFYRELAVLFMKTLPRWKYLLFRYFFLLTRFIPSFRRNHDLFLSMRRAAKDHLGGADHGERLSRACP